MLQEVWVIFMNAWMKLVSKDADFGGAFCLLPPCEDELSVASVRALSIRKSVVTKGTIVILLPLKVVTFKHLKHFLS